MKLLRFASLLFAFTAALRAQIWEFPQPVPLGEPAIATTITLRQIELRYQAPVLLPPIWVQPGTNVTLQLGTWAAPGAAFDWYHDNQKLSAKGTTLALGKITAADAGVYVAALSRPSTDPNTPTTSVTSEMITLRVGQPPRRSLSNLSALVRLTTAQPTFTTGFNLAPTSDGGPATLLIRAVGPSLARFVGDPLAAPRVRVFDGTGADISATSAIMVGGTDPIPDATQRAGAFPLTPGAKDFVQLRAYLPGTYTLQVSSADGGTGSVLLEVYEIP